MSTQYDSEVAMGNDVIFRTSGRKIMVSNVALDVVALILTFVAMCAMFNVVRLNVYMPLMGPWQEFEPFWVLYPPIVLAFPVAVFMYAFVFYKTAALLIPYYAVAFVATGWAVFCLIWLAITWGSRCDSVLWCPCLTSWSQVGGAITMTFCNDTDGDHDASGVFIANFFLLLGVIVCDLVCMGMVAWMHYNYFWRNAAYEVNNPNRTLTINSESREGYLKSREVAHANRANPKLMQRPPLVSGRKAADRR